MREFLLHLSIVLSASLALGTLISICTNVVKIRATHEVFIPEIYYEIAKIRSEIRAEFESEELKKFNEGEHDE